MINFFRTIRKAIIDKNTPSKPSGKNSRPAMPVVRYFKYAIGEIILVVIGILIALQINNWNENQKSIKDERYVLTEVLKNLDEDHTIVSDIVLKRQKTKNAIIALRKYVNSETMFNDSLQLHLVNLLTFERYYAINNAYEILKTKGLQLSNNSLTTKISRYYDYDQPKMSSSILDIEIAILKVYNDPNGLVGLLSFLEKDVRVVLKNFKDQTFKDKLSFFLLIFQDNNGGTLDNLIRFNDINRSLREQINKELKDLN